MNNVTETLESSIISFANSLYAMNSEVKDLYSYYWGTSVNTLIAALASGTTPATTQVSGALSKTDFMDGITLVTALKDLFNNSAVSTSAYLTNAMILINGNYPAVSAVSQDIENMGLRLKTLGANIIALYKSGHNI